MNTCATCGTEVYTASNARVIAPGEDQADPEAGHCSQSPDHLHTA